MVDGATGETIQPAQKPARQECKQGHGRVLIPLLRMVETTALDQRQIQGTVILMNAVRILYEQFFHKLGLLISLQ